MELKRAVAFAAYIVFLLDVPTLKDMLYNLLSPIGIVQQRYDTLFHGLGMLPTYTYLLYSNQQSDMKLGTTDSLRLGLLDPKIISHKLVAVVSKLVISSTRIEAIHDRLASRVR